MEAPSLFEHGNDDRHTFLFLDSKTIPPVLKIRGDDDLGGHTEYIPYQDYSVKGLYLNLAAESSTLSIPGWFVNEPYDKSAANALAEIILVRL
jgi:hypothetical protein